MERGAQIGISSLVPPCTLDGIAPWLITIGENCIVSGSARLLTHDASTYPLYRRYRIGRVTIGDNCFVGHNAIVLPGVTIGNNCVIGAGAVVTRDVPDGAIVGGVPAKAIGNTADDWTPHGVLVEPPFSALMPGQIGNGDIDAFRKAIQDG